MATRYRHSSPTMTSRPTPTKKSRRRSRPNEPCGTADVVPHLFHPHNLEPGHRAGLFPFWRLIMPDRFGPANSIWKLASSCASCR